MRMETKNKLMSMIAPVQSHYHEAYIVYWSRCRQTSFFFYIEYRYIFISFVSATHGLPSRIMGLE